MPNNTYIVGGCLTCHLTYVGLCSLHRYLPFSWCPFPPVPCWEPHGIKGSQSLRDLFDLDGFDDISLKPIMALAYCNSCSRKGVLARDGRCHNGKVILSKRHPGWIPICFHLTRANISVLRQAMDYMTHGHTPHQRTIAMPYPGLSHRPPEALSMAQAWLGSRGPIRKTQKCLVMLICLNFKNKGNKLNKWDILLILDLNFIW